jgi:serine protease Do
MIDLRKKSLLGALGLAVIFIGIFVFFSCRKSASGSSAEEPKTPVVEPAFEPQAGQLARQLSEAFEYASQKVTVSVVPIFAESVVQVQSPFGMPDDQLKNFFGDDFFKRFFGETAPQMQTVRSLGSGVILSKDGYILTNNHVVAKAEKLSVVLNDKKTYKAKVIGADPPTDVAVIKIEADNLPAASLGDSDQVKVGQWVIAVGNPFQLMHTVTAGIISAKGRSSVNLAAYEDFIQTDASINPGNSGGALADLDGNVIGINTAIESPTGQGGSVGIGFAIPINMARQVMNQLMKTGKIVRGYLDLFPQDIDEDLAKALKLKSTEGALVRQVPEGGPADKAGIKRGDVITAFDGKKIADSVELRNLVAQAPPGTKVTVTLIREGKEMNVTVVLGERPAEATTPQRKQQPEQMTSSRLGISVQTLTPDLADNLGYKGDRGVVIVSVVAGSAADDAGLQRGDLIK